MRDEARTMESVNNMLRSTMSHTKRRASKWLVPGCAEVMAAHRTSRSTGVGWLGNGGSLRDKPARCINTRLLR